MSRGRRLLVISTGSFEASVEGRNARKRLDAVRLDGYFERVEYVFFPTHEPRTERMGSGLVVRDVSGRAGGRLTRLLSGSRKIHRIASGLEPDAVACVDPFLSGLLARSIAARFRIPWTLHLVSNYRLSWRVGNLNPMPYLPSMLSFAVESSTIRGADLVFADCGHYREYAVERGARPGAVLTVPRYADPAFYETRPDGSIWEQVGVRDDRPLLYVGRLSPEKYAMELLESFARVAAELPDRELVVLGGGGPLEGAFLEQARERGLEQRIRIVRGLGRVELASAMGSCGVLLATHAGYALLEAALMGAPVVAYDYEWHPELVDDGRTGRLVPFRDAEAMARAALTLLRDPDGARSMGREIRNEARRRYRPETAIQTLRSGYRGLLEGGSDSTDSGAEPG